MHSRISSTVNIILIIWIRQSDPRFSRAQFDESKHTGWLTQLTCQKLKMGGVLENSNPAVYRKVSERKVLPEEEDDNVRDEIDAREVFDILS